MNKASSSWTRSQNKCIEVTTQHEISLSDRNKIASPKRDIIIQEKRRQSSKTKHQIGEAKNKIFRRQKIQQQKVNNFALGLEVTKKIGFLVCLIFILLPNETAAAINCRFPPNLQHLCKDSLQQPHKQLITSIVGTKPSEEKNRSITENKRVLRSIRYIPSVSTDFEDPCRRFVFAPACRGVTSKRSNEFGLAPKLSFASKPFLQSNVNPSLEDLKEGLETSEENEVLQDDQIDSETKSDGKTKRSPADDGYIQADLDKRDGALDSFSSFYAPTGKRSDALNSFSSFYVKRNSLEDKRARALDSFSSFYSPGKRSGALDSFSSFYAPSKKSDALDSFSSFYAPSKKNGALDSFSSFYAPAKRNGALDSFSSLYAPSKKSDALDSFSSFYAPSKKNALDSFSSFYAPSKRNGPLDSFSSFYAPSKRSGALDSFSSFYAPSKRNGALDSFSSFYAPSKRNNDGDDDVLGSFSSFYIPQKRFDYGKREDVLQPFSSFYGPAKKRSSKRNSPLDSFSSFYAPSKRSLTDSRQNIGSFSSPVVRRSDVLDSFSSFYGPAKRSLNNIKRRDVLNSFHSFYSPL